MGAKPKNTDGTADKVVRSHLSQAYKNAKEGKFFDGEIEIEPTKIEEPSSLIVGSKIQVENQKLSTESEIKQLGSVKLTKDTLSDLESILETRELEKFTDGWLSAGLTSVGNPETVGDTTNILVSNVVKEIEATRRLLNSRSVFVSDLQSFIQDSQRRKILLDSKFIPGGADPNASDSTYGYTYSYLNYDNLFSPHFISLMKMAIRAHQHEIGELTDQQFDNVSNLALANLGLNPLEYIREANLPIQKELEFLFASWSKSKIHLGNRFYSTSIILSLSDWIADTIDCGYTPNYCGAIEETNPVNPQSQTAGLNSRLRLREGFPKLVNIGMLKETRSTAFQTTNLTSPGGLQGQGQSQASSNQNFNPNKPNLRVSHDNNPAIRVFRAMRAMVDSGDSSIIFGDRSESTIMSIAHLVSMVRAESLQSLGVDDDELLTGLDLPNIRTRITSTPAGVADVNGVGETIIGKKQENPVERQNVNHNSPLHEIVIAEDPDQRSTYLPFEKSMKRNNEEAGKEDLFDKHLSKILKTSTQEETRRSHIDNVDKVFSETLKKVNIATHGIGTLHGERLRNKAKPWWANNKPLALAHGAGTKSQPGGGPSQVFGTIIGNPMVRLHKSLKRNSETNQFPWDYWSSGNSVGIQNDQEIIAQVTGLVLTIKLENELTGENLRSEIIKAIVRKDMRSLREFGDGFGRTIGYHPQIANEIVSRLEQLNPGTPPQGDITAVEKANIMNAVKAYGLQSLPNDFFHNPELELDADVEDLVKLAILKGQFNHTQQQIDGYSSWETYTFDQGMGPINAVSNYMQGSTLHGYRVSKWATMDHFIQCVAGRELLSHRDDIYDFILRDVDELDRSMKSSHGNTPDSHVNHIDGTFTPAIQSELGIKPGNFLVGSGATKLNAFDRTTLIGIVVDIYARMFENTVACQVGTNQAGMENAAINNYHQVPVLAEITTQDQSHYNQIDRNRAHSYFVTTDIGDNNGLTDHFMMTRGSPYNWENEAKLFKSIISTTRELDYNVFLHPNSFEPNGMGSLMLRNACIRDDTSMWLSTPLAGGTKHIVTQNKRNATVDHEFTHTPEQGPITGISTNQPFGNLPAVFVGGIDQPDMFTVSFGMTPSLFKVGKINASKFMYKVAEGIEFCSRQDGAATRGMLALTRFVNEYTQSARRLREQKDFYAEKEEDYSFVTYDTFTGTKTVEIAKPQDITRNQILSKQTYLNAMLKRIQNLGTGKKSVFAGGRAYDEFRYLNIAALSFIKDMKQRMEDEEINSKEFYFYGIPPGKLYREIIGQTEQLGLTDQEMYYNSAGFGYNQPEKSIIEFKIDYKAESILAPGLKYKTKQDKKGCHLLDNSILESEVIRTIRDIDPEGRNKSYNSILENLQILRVKNVHPFNLNFLGLYDWSADSPAQLLKNLTRYNKIYTEDTATTEQAKNLVRKKLDAFCLKFIVDVVNNLCLNETYLGLKSNNLEKDRYDSLIFLGRWFGTAPSTIIQQQSLEYSDINEEYFDIHESVVNQKPFNEEFKRALQPSLERAEDEPLPRITPPKINNNEIIVGTLIRNSNVLRNFRNIGECKFDEIVAEEFTPSSNLVIDLEETDQSFLNEANTNLNEKYKKFSVQGGAFIVKPVCEIVMKKTSADYVHQDVIKEEDGTIPTEPGSYSVDGEESK